MNMLRLLKKGCQLLKENNTLIIDSIYSSFIPENMLDFDNIIIFFRNKFDNFGNINYSFLEYAMDFYKQHDKLIYKNIIVLPDKKNHNSMMNDSVLYLIWFSKDSDSFFNKDIIREKHIWKDVEWGKRAKNYSKKGKDPSNVWIPTIDDGKGKIIQHLSLGLEGSLKRVFDMTQDGNTLFSVCSEKNIYLSNYNDVLSVLKKSHSKLSFVNSNDSHAEYDIANYEPKNISPSGKIFFGSSEYTNFESDSVDVSITSPPYWDLKNYFKEGQIGQESYSEYIARLNTVWTDMARVTKKNGSVWININIRKKDGIPYFLPGEYIYQFKNLGYKLKDILIWHKSSSIPTSNNNLSDKYEVVLIFSKKNNPIFNRKVFELFSDYKDCTFNGSNFWNINRKAGSVGKKMIHPAIYPTELVNRIVKITCSPGSLVYDPFLGSGTSGIAALNNSCNFIGMEYNEGFKDLIESRFKNELNENTKYIFK